MGALELSPGVASEAYSIAYWCHVYSPLDCWSVYETLTDGLIAAKQERWAALAVHDHDRADRALQEVRDLTELCAAAAEGLASMRLRFSMPATAGRWRVCRKYRIQRDWD